MMSATNGPLQALLRPEISAAAAPFVQSGQWDAAIFESFKQVEARLQQRLGSTKIGDQLVEEAFATKNPVVAISTDQRDLSRLGQLFKGAIGLLKGDRSHGAVPNIPCPSRDSCLRALATASHLLDLLDLDLNIAPTVVAVGQETETTLTILAERATADTSVLINDSPAQAITRTADTILVRLPSGIAGALRVQLRQGLITTPAFVHAAPSAHAGFQGFHRVEEIRIEVFDSDECSHALPVRAVMIRSHEGGRPFLRIFPTDHEYGVGDYVNWQWNLDQPCGPAWYRRGSAIHQAWNSSAYFNGTVIGRAGIPDLTDIELRPSLLRMRLGDIRPLRVWAWYRDGDARWSEDVTNAATVRPTHETVLRAEGRLAVVASGYGSADLRATFRGKLSTSHALVAAVPGGELVEWLGGYRRLAGIAASPSGIFFTNQGDQIFQVRTDRTLVDAARVEMPETVPTGLDAIAIDPSGNIYVRTLWNGAILRLDASTQHRASQRIAVAPSGVAFNCLCWSGALGGLLIGDSEGSIWLVKPGEDISRWSQPLGALIPATAIVSSEDAVWVATRGVAPGVHVAPTNSTAPVRLIAAPFRAEPSALAFRGTELLMVDFYKGWLLRADGEKTETLAEGLLNPTALAVDDRGAVFICNFGGDSVVMLVP